MNKNDKKSHQSSKIIMGFMTVLLVIIVCSYYVNNNSHKLVSLTSKDSVPLSAKQNNNIPSKGVKNAGEMMSSQTFPKFKDIKVENEVRNDSWAKENQYVKYGNWYVVSIHPQDFNDKKASLVGEAMIAESNIFLRLVSINFTCNKENKIRISTLSLKAVNEFVEKQKPISKFHSDLLFFSDVGNRLYAGDFKILDKRDVGFYATIDEDIFENAYDKAILENNSFKDMMPTLRIANISDIREKNSFANQLLSIIKQSRNFFVMENNFKIYSINTINFPRAWDDFANRCNHLEDDSKIPVIDLKEILAAPK